MAYELTPTLLSEFCNWYADRFGSVTDRSSFITSMCGHFHTYTKAAEAILKEMNRAGLVVVKRGTVQIITHP